MFKHLLIWALDKLIIWLITSAWVTPATYSAGQLVTAADLNLIRDNLNALKAPPSDQYENFASAYSISGATFADVDATNLLLSITTTGGDVEITFFGVFTASTDMSAAEYVAFDVLCDGARLGDTTTGMTRTNNNTGRIISFSMPHYNKTGLAAGAHTFKLQAKETAVATISLVSIFFMVRETT